MQAKTSSVNNSIYSTVPLFLGLLAALPPLIRARCLDFLTRGIPQAYPKDPPGIYGRLVNPLGYHAAI